MSFENETNRTSNLRYYLPKAEVKDDNVWIDGRNVFDQPINNIIKNYENIRKIATGKEDDYTIKENYKMVLINLGKKQVLDANPRAIQQINFTDILDRTGKTTMFFIIEEAKETVLDFSQGTVKAF